MIDRQKWLLERRGGIGGSDVAALLGISKWKSPLQLYMEKIGEAADIEENEAMEWGNILEQPVAKKFQSITGKRVRRKNAIIKDKRCPFLMATIDRSIVGENAGLEVKTCSEYKKEDWEGNEDGLLLEIPAEYLVQCLHYLYVTGAERWYMAVLVGGNKFRYGVIEASEHQDKMDQLRRKCIEFWTDYVVPRKMPIPTDLDTDVITSMFDTPIDEQISLTDSVDALVEEYQIIANQIAGMSKRKDELANQIKSVLGNSVSGESNRYLVNWKPFNQSVLDRATLKQDNPEIYKKYCVDVQRRRLTVKTIEKGINHGH